MVSEVALEILMGSTYNSSFTIDMNQFKNPNHREVNPNSPSRLLRLGRNHSNSRLKASPS
jgi:hypothetical protein